MRIGLMNKDTYILDAEFNEEIKTFTNIYEIKNIEYAPLVIYNKYKKEKDILKVVNEWFKARGIPTFRDSLDLLLAKLGIDSQYDLLDESFGLSLSDQYWIKPFDSNIQYKDINFFEHDFDDTEFTNATFSDEVSNTKISLISPNNTTDGRLKKTWIIDNKKRYLLKGAYKNEVMQPFNEVLGSMICDRLNIEHTTYTLDIVNDKVVSKCECFINTNTELVTAHQILSETEDKENAYEEYIKILIDNGIKDCRNKLEDMFLLDYLILNEDRHLNNFGIIRDVNNLKWLSIAPIYDNGQSLNIIDYTDDELIINGKGRFFYKVESFDNIIKIIKDINKYDLTKLDGIVEEFDLLLHKYQNITNMTDRRINKICVLLMSRINKLKSTQNN